MTHTTTQRRILIDDLAALLRKPHSRAGSNRRRGDRPGPQRHGLGAGTAGRGRRCGDHPGAAALGGGGVCGGGEGTEGRSVMAEETKEGMDFFMSPEDEAGIPFEDFITALAVWGWMRPGGQPTVREAGNIFNVSDQVIINAVKAHPWLFFSGDEDDDPTELKIEFEGE